MKILYATQATGNGHLARALSIVPKLLNYGSVEVFVSGTESDIRLPFNIHFKKRGISLHYQKTGRISFVKTLQKMNLLRFLKDVHQLSLNQFDLIINDFEPITAWAARRSGQPVVSMSHQCSFWSPNTPRPHHRSHVGEWIVKNFAPADQAVGFHFERYDRHIETPIIRDEIRNIMPENHGHYTLYMPGYHPSAIVRSLQKLPDQEWHLFTKKVSQTEHLKNVILFPIDQERWLESFGSAAGAIMGAGFEGPSEALFLGKKLMVIPMSGQYEQLCNAVALDAMGIKVISRATRDFDQHLQSWLRNQATIRKKYPDDLPNILDRRIFSNPAVTRHFFETA